MTRRLYPLLAVFGAALALTSEARAICYNDYDAWGWLDAPDTMDDELTPFWCTDYTKITNYWNALDLGDPDGTDWNWSTGGDWCNPNGHTTRLINAAIVMDFITSDTLAPTLELYTSDYYWLGDLVMPHSRGNGYSSDCDHDGAIASNPQADDEPTQLHYAFFWQLAAAERAGTLVHEVVHDWTGAHMDPEFCFGKCGNSCDPSYGGDNPQTIEIYFLHDAVAAFRRCADRDETQVFHLGDALGTGLPICGFLPRLSPETRWRAASTILAKLENCFAYRDVGRANPPTSVWYPTTNLFWDYGGAEFPFDQDNLTRWVCGQLCDENVDGTACDEQAQPGNVAINAFNREHCALANAQVHEGVTANEWVTLQSQYTFGKSACIPGYSAAYVAAYCADLSAAAGNVADIEAAWDLADYPGAFDSGWHMRQCMGAFCTAHFDPAWEEPAMDVCYEWDDPIGCTAYLCGSLTELAADYGATSSAYFSGVQCRKHLLSSSADPGECPAPPGDAGPCEEEYIACRNLDPPPAEPSPYDEWVAAQAAGTCSLVIPGPNGSQPSTNGNYDLGALHDIRDITSYRDFTATHQGISLHPCMGEYLTCKSTIRSQVDLLARLVDVSDFRWAEPTEPGVPGPRQPGWNEGEVLRNVETLAGFVVLDDEEEGLGRAEALDRLLTNPESILGLAQRAGPEVFFGAVGADARHEGLFGSERVAEFSDAVVSPLLGRSATERQLLTGLARGREVRDQLGSAAAVELYTRAAESQPGAYYSFLHTVANAESAEAASEAYTALEGAMP